MVYFQSQNPAMQVMLDNTALGGLIGFILAFIFFAVLILLILYFYVAFAWYTIGKKLGYKKSWLAWIPIANLFLLPILAKKHWAWGWFILIPPIYFILAIIWIWLIFERRGFPGALSLILLFSILPIVGGIFFFAFLVMLGIVAWSDMNRKRSTR